ncbi:hypothetical protein DFP72DRAFT_1072303 [Ephemerocybe angulata]|uniref:Uncharacterized protein n=1 Tax=Ephemerocybe angulata TaxID=980116 RepID=A0A8H6HRR9_9AGAR|nr:hypothetical protein DFP72DRAFT_1072303 [Tulosesus angulatus]
MRITDLVDYPLVSATTTHTIFERQSSKLLSHPSNSEELHVYPTANNWSRKFDSLWRIPVEDENYTSADCAVKAALTAARDRELHAGIRAIVRSPRFAGYFFVDATSKDAVDTLLPEGTKEEYHKCPPLIKSLEDHHAYGVSSGQWFLFVGQSACGSDYLALGLSKRFDAVRGVVTAFTLANTGKDLLLVLEENRSRYFNEHHTDIVDEGHDTYATTDLIEDRLHFRYGLQVVTLPARATSVPVKEPPGRLVELFNLALAPNEPNLFNASVADLRRFRPEGLAHGARCKVVKGPFAGTCGSIYLSGAYPSSALTSGGLVRVSMRWKGRGWHVPIPPSYLRREFEIGDLISATSVTGSTEKGWITAFSRNRSIYTIATFESGNIEHVIAAGMKDWEP